MLFVARKSEIEARIFKEWPKIENTFLLFFVSISIAQKLSLNFKKIINIDFVLPQKLQLGYLLFFEIFGGVQASTR